MKKLSFVAFAAASQAVGTKGKVPPTSCPRFHRCSIPVCPLEATSNVHRVALSGESVCSLPRHINRIDGLEP